MPRSGAGNWGQLPDHECVCRSRACSKGKALVPQNPRRSADRTPRLFAHIRSMLARSRFVAPAKCPGALTLLGPSISLGSSRLSWRCAALRALAAVLGRGKWQRSVWPCRPVRADGLANVRELRACVPHAFTVAEFVNDGYGGIRTEAHMGIHHTHVRCRCDPGGQKTPRLTHSAEMSDHQSLASPWVTYLYDSHPYLHWPNSFPKNCGSAVRPCPDRS